MAEQGGAPQIGATRSSRPDSRCVVLGMKSQFLWTGILEPRLWLSRARLALHDFDKTPPVLIYQMGKVGSSAVYASLSNAVISNPVYHVHFLSYGNINRVERYYRTVGASQSIAQLRFLRALRRKLDRTGGPIHVITLVRDPVAREISDVFENMDSHHRSLLTGTGGIDISKTIDRLNASFAEFDEAKDYACTWFDREMLDTFGIDVYATPFDHDRKFTIVAKSGVDLLIMRMEDLPTVFSEAIRQFLGEAVPLVRANDASAKDYHAAYQAVISEISLSRDVYKRIYASRYARHFYPEGIRADFMAE